jgi:hypothetical protein
MLLGGVTFSR